jgi:glycine cleavage system H lipoate-binding protein
MKTEKRILAEIEVNKRLTDKAKTIRSLTYNDGWIDALEWVLE